MVVQVKSRLENGVVVPPLGMEVIVSDHCNLVCNQCNHGSPGMAKWVADPADVARHLAILGRYYRPGFAKLIGGEPLLHPDLAGLAAAVRGSGITGRLQLVTNGTLIDRMTDAAWRQFDEVQISRYAGMAATEENLPLARAKARAFGVKLDVVDLPEFRETFSSVGTSDDALVADVYAACKLANFWGMQGLYRGRLYRCPQSMYTARLAQRDFQEGIAIAAAPDFAERLLAFLNSPAPLQSCRFCVGTSGKKIPQRFVERRHWAQSLARPLDELVDRDLVARALIEIDLKDDCIIPTELGYRP